MILHNSSFGQRSNRIILASHVLASSLATSQNVRLYNFIDLQDDYTCYSDKLNISNVKICRPSLNDHLFILDKLHIKIRENFQKDTSTYYQFLRNKIYMKRKGIILIQDWRYRDYDAVEKYKDQICCFFSPKDQHIEKIKKIYTSQLRGKFDIIVGVHIRRGDYKDWNGGKFYFNNDVYNRAMLSLTSQLNTMNKKVAFIIFSTDKIEKNMFPQVESLFIPNGTPIEDHWLMSKCDYLCGPPSTFSRWAAYMGNCPLYFIEDKNSKIKIEDFKYMSI